MKWRRASVERPDTARAPHLGAQLAPPPSARVLNHASLRAITDAAWCGGYGDSRALTVLNPPP